MAAARKLVSKLPVVVILGATGTGKSKLAIEMALKFNGEILSADSMQVYKGLDIVTNKVTPEEMAQCPHHMINYVNPLHYQHTVVDFRNKALPIIDKILARDRIPIIVGGTNYYIESLLWDMLIDTQKSDEQGQCGTEASSSGDGGNQSERSDVVSETPGGSTLAERPLHSADCQTAGPEEVHDVNVKVTEKPGVAEGACSNERSGRDNRTTPQLYSALQTADPVSAKRIHPNDRRKIIRALEVCRTEGRPLSALLAEQHAATGGGGVSGPLRYEPTTVFSIQADRQVLDERTDRRVDQMIEAGLVEELSQFHEQYNQARLQDNSEADYTLGIFQSIGFKEFHEYLLLDKKEREEAKGKALFTLGVEEMKRVTRRYARKQTTWFNNRFLKRRGSSVPPVYRLDSTDPARWEADVHAPAARILDAVLKGEVPPIAPMPCQESTNEPAYNHCDICQMVFVTTRDWEAHMKGRRHRNRLKRKKLTEDGSRVTKMGKPNQSPPNDENKDAS